MITSGEFTASDSYAFISVDKKSKNDVLNGWQAWNKQSTGTIHLKAGDTVKVSFGVKATAKSWGAIDEVRFEKK